MNRFWVYVYPSDYKPCGHINLSKARPNPEPKLKFRFRFRFKQKKYISNYPKNNNRKVIKKRRY